MIWAHKVNLVLAVGIAALVALFTSDQPDLLPRILLVLALILLSRDVLDAAERGMQRARGLARLTDPRFWLFVWLNAAQTAAVLATFMWTGPVIDVRVILLGAGLGMFIGLTQAFMPTGAPRDDARFDLDRSSDARLLGRFVIYGWPFAATAIIVGGALSPPDGGWQGVYPLFQMVFLPFLLPLFPLRGGLVAAWQIHAPRLSGFVLLITALIIA